MTDVRTPSEATPSRRRPVLRALQVSLAVAALLFGGLTYAVRVSGLEVPTPAGVPVVLVERPVGGPMPARERAVYQQVFDLAERYPRDLGRPGYDWRRGLLFVNVATDRGEKLVGEIDALEETHTQVRVGALSVAEIDRLTEVAFDRIDPVYSAGYDGVEDRVVLTTNRLRGVLGPVGELFEPGDVAVVYYPFQDPPRAA